MDILEIKNVTYNYSNSKEKILSSVNQKFELGQFYAIIGKSGAGNGFAKPRGIVSVLCHDQRVLREILYRLVRSDVSKTKGIVIIEKTI